MTESQAAAHSLSCPGRAAAWNAAAQSRDPRDTQRSANWAPALQRTAKRRCAASGAR